MTCSPAEPALQAATTNQPSLARELEAPCAPGLGHFISVLAEGAECCGNSFGGNRIPEPILAAALKEREDGEEELLFKYLVSKHIYLQLQVY